MEKNVSLRYLFGTAAIAGVLWYIIFALHPLNFWASMCIAIAVLLLLAFLASRPLYKLPHITLRAILIGIVSAAALYAVFFAGNVLAGLLFPFKDAQIASVYGNKAGMSPLLIGALLLFVIGPGEEIFWRGFLQKNLSARWGEKTGYLLATALYTGVHLVSGNLMLVIAACVCGIFWGWLYKREKSLLPVVISHALWDFTIFMVLPIQ